MNQQDKIINFYSVVIGIYIILFSLLAMSILKYYDII